MAETLPPIRIQRDRIGWAAGHDRRPMGCIEFDDGRDHPLLLFRAARP